MFDAIAARPGLPSFLSLYIEDCDTKHERALQAGATTVTELSTNAWGDRGSRIRDPFASIWWIQTHVEDDAAEEMSRRMGEPADIDDMRIARDTLGHDLRGRAMGRISRDEQHV